MAYGKWSILETETIDTFGYSLDELRYGSHQPVKVLCDCCGIKAVKPYRDAERRHRCKSIINGIKKCFKCKKYLSVEEDFSKNRSTPDGYQKICKDCFANYDCVKVGYENRNRKIRENLEDYFNFKIVSIKARMKKKNLTCEVDGKYLYNIYLNQDGKCYYTNIPIKHNIGVYDFDSISVERLDPNKGYVLGNIVLCAYGINSFKGSLTEQEFKEKLKQVIPGLITYSRG